MSDDATRIHIANPNPPMCAACYQQQPQMTHVDFGASYDGPFFSSEVTGANAVSIDDLVVCEDCVRAAARLLGMVDPQFDASRAAAADQKIADLSERLAGAVTYINRLEDAAQAREKLETVMKPKKTTRSANA
jgi:hypothetical protein